MAPKLQAYKTAFHIEAEADLFICSTIRHDNGFWLVPTWIEQSTKGLYQPERIIRIDRFGPKPTFGHPHHDFQLSEKVPRSLISDPHLEDIPGSVELRPAIYLEGEPPHGGAEPLEKPQ